MPIKLNKACRLLIILIVALFPFIYMWDGVLFQRMIEYASIERLLRRAPILFVVPAFGFWTSVLALIVHSWVCWFKRPTLYTGLYMFFVNFILGIILIFFVHQTFYFSSPGDGPIP